MSKMSPHILCLVILWITCTSLSAHTAYERDMSSDIKNRVQSLHSSLRIKYTDEVEEKVKYYVEKNRALGELMLGRSSMYFPLFEGIFEERNMPKDLIYIAVVESGLNPQATSRSHAAGLWQFIKSTAKYVGLTVSKAVDERRDPIKSTYAAADYLQYLYDIYNDWTLAAAAYNCGPGNVNKAIKRAGGANDFWDIINYLPKETQAYVPKIIAVSYLMNYYYMHDLQPVMYEDHYIMTGSVKVSDRIDLRDIAKRYDLPLDLVKKLNPSYTKNFIPASDGKHFLTLPEEQLYAFVNEMNAYDDVFHLNVGNSTPSLVDQIDEMLEEKEEIPAPITMREEIEAPQPLSGIQDEAIMIEEPIVVFKLIKLKRGQSLSDIAAENNMDLEELLSLNNYNEANLPNFGDLIKVNI